jgi:hypothetical protein
LLYPAELQARINLFVDRYLFSGRKNIDNCHSSQLFSRQAQLKQILSFILQILIRFGWGWQVIFMPAIQIVIGCIKIGVFGIMGILKK